MLSTATMINIGDKQHKQMQLWHKEVDVVEMFKPWPCPIGQDRGLEAVVEIWHAKKEGKKKGNKEGKKNGNHY